MPPKTKHISKFRFTWKHKRLRSRIDFIVWEVKTYVPETKGLPTMGTRDGRDLAQLRADLSLDEAPLTLPDSKIVETVKGGSRR